MHCSDPEYFDNPNEFNPERFTLEKRKKRHKCHFMPFGEGPRMCMGWRYGLTQVKAAVVTVLRNFQINVSSKQQPIKIDPTSFLKQAKDRLLINITPRQ